MGSKIVSLVCGMLISGALFACEPQKPDPKKIQVKILQFLQIGFNQYHNVLLNPTMDFSIAKTAICAALHQNVEPLVWQLVEGNEWQVLMEIIESSWPPAPSFALMYDFPLRDGSTLIEKASNAKIRRFLNAKKVQYEQWQAEKLANAVPQRVSSEEIIFSDPSVQQNK